MINAIALQYWWRTKLQQTGLYYSSRFLSKKHSLYYIQYRRPILSLKLSHNRYRLIFKITCNYRLNVRGMLYQRSKFPFLCLDLFIYIIIIIIHYIDVSAQNVQVSPWNSQVNKLCCLKKYPLWFLDTVVDLECMVRARANVSIVSRVLWERPAAPRFV